MKIIDLDAASWKNVLDFYDAVLAAVGAPKGHGRNPNALVDSMVWGGMNTVEPPYTIKISRTESLPKDVREHIDLVEGDIAKARMEHRKQQGNDVDVSIKIEP